MQWAAFREGFWGFDASRLGTIGTYRAAVFSPQATDNLGFEPCAKKKSLTAQPVIPEEPGSHSREDRKDAKKGEAGATD